MYQHRIIFNWKENNDTEREEDNHDLLTAVEIDEARKISMAFIEHIDKETLKI